MSRVCGLIFAAEQSKTPFPAPYIKKDVKSLKRLFCAVLALAMLPVINPAAAGEQNIAAGAKAEVCFFDCDGNFLNIGTPDTSGLTDNNSFSLYKTPNGVERGSIILDLYYIREFNRVYMREVNSCIRGFEIYTSTDKRGWTLRFTGTTVGTSGVNACFDKPVKARYVKIELTKTDNLYKDASITFSDIEVSKTSAAVRDDLENALSEAEVMRRYISSDNMSAHFGAEQQTVLNNEIEIAEDVLDSGAASQADINRACERLKRALAQLKESIVPNASDFDIIEQRYMDFFVKNNTELTEARLGVIRSLEAEAENIRQKMIKRPKASELWEEYTAPMANSTQEPGKIANSLAKVKRLAIAYKQNGNRLCGDETLFDDILYALNFILDNKYDPSIEMYGNWYYWQISVPATMTDIMVILKEDLPEEMLQRMEEAIIYRIGNDFHYTWYGANRMYLAAISLKLGTARNNEEYIHRAVYSISEENACKDAQSYNSSGDDDGYFWDGSYMFHSGIMYNATYGRDQLSNTLSIVGYLYNTPWQIDSGLIEDLASKIPDVYEYVIYNGRTVDVTAGRGLGDGESYGLNIANSIQELAGYLNEPRRSELLGIAKQFKLELGIDDALTRDDNIEARGKITKLKRYPIGDKLVLHTPDYGFGLSMFSDRTKCFEAPNGDAMKAWYVSSGMTQLLNGDTEQYDRDYWIAVDHYRLAGTTVDRIARSLTRYEGEIYNANDWCGMTDLDEMYGAAGFMPTNWNSSMTAKKSYFIFDNEIVCMGTDISKGTNNIETTVENRKIKDGCQNTVLVNGGQEIDGSVTVNNVNTVWLEGNTEGSDIGYWFPGGAKLNMLKEERTADEADMWLSDTTASVTKSFFTMWYDHGKQPQNEYYAYTILPGFGREETEAYASKPDIEILDKSSDVHSVRDNTLGVTGYNFWNKRGGEASGVTADGQVTLITRNSGGEFQLSLTDPTFKAERAVTLCFEFCVSEISESDERIEIESMQPLKIKVDMSGINGRNITLKAVK